MNASDVLAAIWKRHDGSEWSRFSEVGIAGSRRADAICVNTWASTGFAIHGFEIKVSRADFIHEMKDISKWKKIGQFCNFFWLAAPKGLVDVSEVPERWGLMELQKNGLRIKKQAPELHPEPISNWFLAALLRKERIESDKAIELEVERLADERAERKAIVMNQKLAGLERREQEAQEKIKAFEEFSGVDFSYYQPSKIKAAFKIAKNLLSYGGGTSDFRSLIASSEAAARSASRIVELLNDLRGGEHGRS